MDALTRALFRARNRLQWRVASVGAQRSHVELVEDLARELGLSLPPCVGTPSSLEDARGAVRAAVEAIELAHLSPETRARVAGHLGELRRLASHTTRVAATGPAGEAVR